MSKCQNGGISVLSSIRKTEVTEGQVGEQGEWGMTVIGKRKYEMVHCRDATASSFVVKSSNIFTVTIKCNSSMHN
jgi:hypothetical protein